MNQLIMQLPYQCIPLNMNQLIMQLPYQCIPLSYLYCSSQLYQIIRYLQYKMLPQNKNYQKMIKKATSNNQLMLFPKVINQGSQSTVKQRSDLILPSQHLFKSSQQINNNLSKMQNIIHQTLQQSIQKVPIFSNQWPHSCIGLVLCEYYQNNETYYVYGTGTLIHKNIVLTSAQNVYCHQLHTQYTNIRFLTGVSGRKCNGIYDVKGIYYPKEYTIQGYKNKGNYNFATLQLYEDLGKSCGYVGWMTKDMKQIDKGLITYGYYMSDKKQGSFELIQISKYGKYELNSCSGSGVLMKQQDKYYLVGLYNSSQTKVYSGLSEKMRNMINQQITLKSVNLRSINMNEWYRLFVNIPKDINQINLTSNLINAQGCKYMSQATWRNLISIHLNYNNIGLQGCMFLSQANWTYLTIITLDRNKIGSQGCKFLNQANWKHLIRITLNQNNINTQGCRYLSQTNWIHLKHIDLRNNKFGVEGCKYLSQTNWMDLSLIQLSCYKMDVEYRANYSGQIRFRKWYLNQVKWINLGYEKINIIDLTKLKQLWPRSQIH